jgi:hypothetical protein
VHIWHASEKETQAGSERSFIGGCPMLPSGFPLPQNEKTQTEMTFFFQIAMPETHRWCGRTISVFASTDHVDDQSFLPKLPVPLAGATLDRAFFSGYQSYFRVFVFRNEDISVRTECVSPVAFHRLHLTHEVPPGSKLFGSMTPTPDWILDDESPNDFEGWRDLIAFLFQTKLDYEFATVPDAPRQKVIDYSNASSGLVDSAGADYSLFVSNETYYFGIEADQTYVYIVPQS